MTVTGVSPELREPLFTQVSRIIGSDVLRGSESLCHLLDFLVTHAISDPGNPAKEYRIATEVFGRSEKFDPRLDSTVRVQTSRLRAKLAEYYAGPGASDPVVVEIPKGAYSVSVHLRPARETPAAAPAKPAVRGYRIAVAALSAACCILIAAVVYLRAPRAAAEPVVAVPQSLRTFWHGFTDPPDRTWVVFSNAEFVGRPETGMRYFDSTRDKGRDIFDHYTGIGEVMAIHALDQLFAQFRHGLIAKRGRLLAMDDVKNNDLIFIGSPSENLPLRVIAELKEFVFRRPASGERKGDLAIFNLNPATGEQAVYFAGKEMPLTEDYAVIGLMPGPAEGRHVMVLAGTSTIGTQAAVEFVCSEAGAAQLLRRAGASGSFEALIHVRIRLGVPVAEELVALHKRAA